MFLYIVLFVDIGKWVKGIVVIFLLMRELEIVVFKGWGLFFDLRRTCGLVLFRERG